jgi:glycopeptide antibiotics resistance protein
VQRHCPGDSPSFRFRATGLALLGVHLLLVGWLTLRPLSVPWVAAANLEPFATIRSELAHGPWAAAQHLGPSLLLLAPLGVLLPMATGRLTGSWLGSFTHTVFTGGVISLGIEVLQTDVPGRTLDVDALLLNTAGVALAHLLLAPLLKARLCGRRRDRGARPAAVLREEVPPEVAPTMHKVGIAP